MLERRLDWRRYALLSTALLTGILLFWIALHCDGADWYISQTHADIIYTGLRRFGEFPFFSFIINGGTYFVQDPQSNLFSPAVPLILLAGPSIGLRLLEGLWGVAGVYVFTIWLRRRMSAEAAMVGAVAMATSLGVLWKIAVGNDMFLWHLGLPVLLWAVERVMQKRTIESALVFALALGVLLLGPTFHSFTYLFLPVVPLYVLVEWAFERPTRRDLLKTIGLFALACVLALSMIGFKVACWTKFPMARPVGDMGTLPLWTGIKQLFDYSLVQTAVVVPSRYIGKGAHWASRGWGVEEGATAVPPIAVLLALVGVVFAARSRPQWKTGLFALILVLIGLTLTCWSPAWETFRKLNGGNFRVAQRCLGMAAYGVAIFAALGAQALLSRLKQATVMPVALGLVGIMLASAVWWTHAAGRHLGEMANDVVRPDAMNPLEVMSEERKAADSIESYTHIRRYRGQRDILSGTGYTDGFLVVGNEFKPSMWAAQRRLPVLFDPNFWNKKKPAFGDVTPDQVSVENVRIKLRRIPPHARFSMRVNLPEYGMVVTTTPSDAKLVVKLTGNQMEIENQGDEPVERAVIRAKFPVSIAWVVLSMVAVIGTIIALIELNWTPARAVSPVTSDARS
jgi:hypothetical protein